MKRIIIRIVRRKLGIELDILNYESLVSHLTHYESYLEVFIFSVSISAVDNKKSVSDTLHISDATVLRALTVNITRRIISWYVSIATSAKIYFFQLKFVSILKMSHSHYESYLAHESYLEVLFWVP